MEWLMILYYRERGNGRILQEMGHLGEDTHKGSGSKRAVMSLVMMYLSMQN